MIEGLKKQGTLLIFNFQGFSIVSVLVAASVGSFVLLGLTKSLTLLLRNTNSIESKMVSLELTKEIIATLEAPPPSCDPPCRWSKSSCTNTLSGFNDVSGNEETKSAILSATHSVDQPTASQMYSTSINYNGVSIKEMKVVSGNTGDDIITLKVWFETSGDSSRGVTSPEMSRPFEIYAKVNYAGGSNRVESCTAVITSYSTFSGKNCASNEYFKGFDNVGMMECVPLPECADNEYLKGFDSNGMMECVSLPECADNEYLKGFDSDGDVICLNRSTLISSQVCPSGQYLRGFDSNGNKVCNIVPAGPRGPQGPQGLRGPPGNNNPPRCANGWSTRCQQCIPTCDDYFSEGSCRCTEEQRGESDE